MSKSLGKTEPETAARLEGLLAACHARRRAARRHAAPTDGLTRAAAAVREAVAEALTTLRRRNPNRTLLDRGAGAAPGAGPMMLDEHDGSDANRRATVSVVGVAVPPDRQVHQYDAGDAAAARRRSRRRAGGARHQPGDRRRRAARGRRAHRQRPAARDEDEPTTASWRARRPTCAAPPRRSASASHRMRERGMPMKLIKTESHLRCLEDDLLLLRRGPRRLPRSGARSGADAAYAHRDEADRQPRRDQADRRRRAVRPRAVLLELAERVQLGVGEDGQGAGAVAQPLEAGRHVRAAEVLPALRVRYLPGARPRPAADRARRSSRPRATASSCARTCSSRPCSSAAPRTASRSRRSSRIWSSARPSDARRHGSRLPHHAAVLRQRRAAPRPHVHHRRRRHAGALAPRSAATRCSSSPAPTSTATRSSQAAAAAGVTPREHADRVSALFRDTWDQCGIRLRPLHPHHRRLPRAHGAGAAAPHARRRRRLLRQLRRPVLLRLRALLHREGAGRRQVPRPPGGADLHRGRELLLPHERLPAAPGRRPRGATRAASCRSATATRCWRCCAARRSAICASRAPRRASPGASSCRSTTATSPTSGAMR